MKHIKWTEPLISVGIALAGGAISALAAGGSFRAYYDSLEKPPIAPPGAVFPIAWTVLYVLMGISAYLIYTDEHEGRRRALTLYAIQLLVNYLWTPVFFGLKSTGGALAVILVLAVLICLMLRQFWRIRRLAAWLNVPYLLWVLYATYLTAGFYVLNPAA